MDENAIKNIHDKYFKQTFGDIETTIAFLEEYLPKEITEDIDYSSLNLINPSSIGKDFKLSESDLLFKVKIGKVDWYLYFLIEHKSYVDEKAALQVLRYITDIWLRELKNYRQITPVMPILFYQGKKSWQFRQLKEFLPDNLSQSYYKYLPLYELLYYDFSFEKQGKARSDYLPLDIYLQTIQKVYEEDKESFITKMTEIFIKIAKLDEATQIEYFERVLIYFTNLRKDLDEEDYYRSLERIGGEEKMKTLVDKWVEQGIEQGIEQGKITAIVNLVKEGIISKELGAQKLNLSEQDFEAYL